MFDLSPRAEEEQRPARPDRWSLLDLDERAPAPPEISERDLFDLERKSDRAFPIERAILFSIAAHILILVFVLHAPGFSSLDSHKGLLGEIVESERQRELDRQIPIVFRSAPDSAALSRVRVEAMSMRLPVP